MPEMPPSYRPPGLPTRNERGREQDRRRRQALPWRGWYNLKAWKVRRRLQLEAEPCCARCAKAGRVVAATVANHNPPHNGNWWQFLHGPLESVCAACHDSEVAREEHALGLRRGRGGSRKSTG